MKKTINHLLTLLLILSCTLTGCTSSKTRPSQPQETTTNLKTLVVYFSMPDDRSNSYVEVDGGQLGNTQYLANVITKNTNADTFRIQPITPYPTNHEELLKVAQEEIKNDARPEINGTISNFDSYDIIFVGYPTWNADMPNILYTFFDTYDFSNKTIIPFNTHGGSGFGSSKESIAKLEPNATLLEGKSISRNDIENAKEEIINWLNTIDLLKNN